jgi:catalase
VITTPYFNAQGKSTSVKFHWKPKLGLQSVVRNEAVKINGADPDFHRRDLCNAIQMSDYPEWELGLQLGQLRERTGRLAGEITKKEFRGCEARRIGFSKNG